MEVILVPCKIVLLDFYHRLNYKIIQLRRFESWILLLSSGNKGEEDRKLICWDLVQSRSAASATRGPNRYVFYALPLFLRDDESRIRLSKRRNFII
jgi:hypothetical protein